MKQTMNQEQAVKLLRVVIGTGIEDAMNASMLSAEKSEIDFANLQLKSARRIYEAAHVLGIDPAINRDMKRAIEDGDTYR
jgi:putative ubiquitin-RnfH superfamily antitoxin RatB of RatAB toxin-antitoxin module